MTAREEVLAYALSFADVYTERPFRDQNWQLVRIKGSKKTFLWIYDRGGYLNLNVKVAPEWRDFWRNTYPAVVAGYHQNKMHWNTIILDGTIPEEKRNHYLRIVSQEVKRLSRLVKTMLDLSKIDSGEMKLRLTRFDLSNTVFVTLLSFEKAIEDKKIEIRGLETASSLFVDGDPDMIHQVLYNLLENAVKFTNVEGYIDIRLAETNDRVTVTIKNSGPGIPADEVAMIFDRFYKTDKSRSQDKNGMCLGLYIVRTIIRLHGGEISVSSVENEFCQFEFWLPKKIKDLNSDKGKDSKEPKDSKWSNPLKSDNKQAKTDKKAKKKEDAGSAPEVIEVTDVEIVEKPKDDDAALH